MMVNCDCPCHKRPYKKGEIYYCECGPHIVGFGLAPIKTQNKEFESDSECMLEKPND